MADLSVQSLWAGPKAPPVNHLAGFSDVASPLPKKHGQCGSKSRVGKDSPNRQDISEITSQRLRTKARPSLTELDSLLPTVYSSLYGIKP